jgi:hypothetical protein
VLAKYYRERGKNELALLWAGKAQALVGKIPESALFIETDAYRPEAANLEVSIAGFYSKSAHWKAQAGPACLELAISRKAFPVERDMARRNSIHYAKRITDEFPKCNARMMEVTGVQVRKDFAPTNPSVAMHDGRLFAVVRSVNYRLKNGAYFIFDKDNVVRTENYFGTINPATGAFEGVVIGEAPEVWKRDPGGYVQGFEDLRLFCWRGEWWALSTVRDHQEGRAINEIVLLRLVDERDNSVRIASVHRLCPGTRRYEKNWVPIVEDDKLFILYGADPTHWLEVDPEAMTTKVYATHGCGLALDHLRGGTQFVRSGDGWLYLAHEAIDHNHGRGYLHRLVWFTNEKKIEKISDPFFFDDRQIEFAAGLCRLPSGHLVASYGVNDCEARICVFEEPVS